MAQTSPVAVPRHRNQSAASRPLLNQVRVSDPYTHTNVNSVRRLPLPAASLRVPSQLLSAVLRLRLLVPTRTVLPQRSRLVISQRPRKHQLVTSPLILIVRKPIRVVTSQPLATLALRNRLATNQLQITMQRQSQVVTNQLPAMVARPAPTQQTAAIPQTVTIAATSILATSRI